MKCATCELKKVAAKTPFHQCSNEHMQRKDCTEQLDGECGPTTLPVEIEAVANSSYVFSTALFADIETQSSISQEHLSMQASRETLSESEMPRLVGAQQLLTNSFLDTIPAAPRMLHPQECVQKDSNYGAQQRFENGMEQTREDPSLAIKTAKHDVKYRTQDRVLWNGEGNCGKGILDETDDFNIVLASEIRFMESTESLQNYYSGSTPHTTVRPKLEELPLPQPPLPTVNQQRMLSAKLLHDSEFKKSINSCEFVESYLCSYGPLALCQFPAYSFNHSCHNNNCDNWTTARAAPTRTISISTESEPSLMAKKPELSCKPYPPADYFVMHATGDAVPEAGTLPNGNKMEQTSIDMRLQKVLETFQEDSRPLKVSEKPLIDQSKNFTKMHAALTPILQLQPEAIHSSSRELSAEKTSTDILTHVSNSHRAFYNPPTEPVILGTRLGSQLSCHSVEPPPQFQMIGCSKASANELIMSNARYANLVRPIPACQLKISRSPIKCPESACQRTIFVSNFNTHLTVDHSKLPMERIAPHQCKNFFIDPRLAHYGVSKCHLLYLIRDKICDLGGSKFKDFLPLVVMSTRVSLLELCGVNEVESAEIVCRNSGFLMIWLTGIVPDQFPVSVSLTVWPRSGQVPTFHLVHSGEVYSIRKSQCAVDVWQSGQMLLLSSREVEMLTNGGKEMLQLQLIVH